MILLGRASTVPQLMAGDNKMYARLGWTGFGRKKNKLRTMMFRDVTTALNERKHLKNGNQVGLILDQTELRASLPSPLYTWQNKSTYCAIERRSKARTTSWRTHHL